MMTVSVLWVIPRLLKPYLILWHIHPQKQKSLDSSVAMLKPKSFGVE